MNVFDDDLHVRGRLTADTLAVPNSSVGNAQVKTSEPIQCDRIFKHVDKTERTDHGSAVATFRRVVHVAVADGEIQTFRAGVVVANVGAATITVNLYKNGASIVTPITLDNSQAAFEVVVGSGLTAAYAADDVFEVVVTAAAGGGTLGQGLFVQFQAFEEPG